MAPLIGTCYKTVTNDLSDKIQFSLSQKMLQSQQ